MDWLYKDLDHLWQNLAASLLILIGVIVVVRIAGLRTFSKMTSFDFAVTVAIGSILGGTAAGSFTVLQGVVAVAALVLYQAISAMLMRRSDAADKLLSNKPLLIMEGNQIFHDNLKHARMAEDELIGKLREANVTDLNQVLAVVLETTGDVSVLHNDSDDAQLDDYLLRDVRRHP